MKHLLQVSLIPHSESRPWFPTTDSAVCSEVRMPTAANTMSDTEAPNTPQFTFGASYLDNTVFNDGGGADAPSDKTTPDKYSLNSPPKILPRTSSSRAIPQPSKALRDATMPAILGRPLPEPPGPESRRSSRSSLRSTCPSLTPSLANYVDNGNFGDDEVNIGMARTVMTSVPSVVDLPLKKPEVGDGSMSDYDNSPPSTAASQSPTRHSPKKYLSTTGSVLEHDMAQFTSPIVQDSPRTVQSRLPISASESTLLSDPMVSQLSTLSISESEWMRRTPSPVDRKPASRLWSPKLEKKPAGVRSDEMKRRGRFSDVGPRALEKTAEETYTGNFAGNNVLGQVEADDHANIECIVRQLERTNNGAKHHPTGASAKSSAESSRNTWESFRGPRHEDYGVCDRPVGNWI
jgi:hypothetical protein